MEILSFSAADFGRLNLFSHEMKDGNIFYGDHGAGKTQAILSVMTVLSGEEYKSIDDPITKGKNKHKNVVELKVEPGDEITMMDHIFRCEAGDNITCALIKTKSGSPELTLFNSTTGKQFKGTTTDTRKIVDRFLGRFPDPKKLDDLATGTRSKKEEFVKIVASMSRTKDGGAIDFTPFIKREEEARDEHAVQKAHLKALNDDQAAKPVPQDNWAKDPIDQKSVSDEIQRLNAHDKKETERKQAIQNVERKEADQLAILSALVEEKTSMDVEVEKSFSAIKLERESIVNLEGKIADYQQNHPIVKPEDTEDLAKQIEALQKKLTEANVLTTKNQKIEQTISDQQNKVATRKQLADQAEKTNNDRDGVRRAIREKIDRIEKESLPLIQAEVKRVWTDNQPLPWLGEKDPEGKLGVLEYLNKLMSDAMTANKQVADRETYEEQAKKIESTKKQMQEATDSINQVKEDERMVIEASVFPHPGIQIRRGDDNKVNVWVKDPHDVWITYNDANHAHRLFYSTNIVTHGVGGDLKLLVVREGYALHDYMQKLIIETANRKGFKVMLETLVSSDKNAIYLGESEKPQEIVSAPLPDGESVPDMPAWGMMNQDQVEGRNRRSKDEDDDHSGSHH